MYQFNLKRPETMDICPEGRCGVRVVGAEEKTSASGLKRVELKLLPLLDRKAPLIYENVMLELKEDSTKDQEEFFIKKLYNLLYALEMVDDYGEVNFETKDFLNRECYAEVAHEDYKGRKKARIKLLSYDRPAENTTFNIGDQIVAKVVTDGIQDERVCTIDALLRNGGYVVSDEDGNSFNISGDDITS